MSDPNQELTPASAGHQAATDASRDARAEQRRRLEELAAACALDEHELLLELRHRGLPVTSVWDFVASGGAPPEAVPILVAHLSRDHHERIWDGIVRALAVRHARVAALGVLTDLYRKESKRSRRWALANAIGSMASLDEVQDLPGIEMYRALFRDLR